MPLPISRSAVVVLAVLLGPAAAADARLHLTRLDQVPTPVAVGEAFSARATIQATGARGGRGELVAGLRDGAAPYAVPRRLGVRAFRAVRPGSTRRVQIRLRVPRGTSPGGYRVQVCLRPLRGTHRPCVRTGRIVVRRA